MTAVPFFQKGRGTLDEPFNMQAAEITQPGVYDITLEDYHSDICDGPSLSSGGINQLLRGTPKAFWHSSPLNPNRPAEAGPARHLRVGGAAHTLVMEPHTFRSRYKVRPAEWDSWRTKEARNWRDRQQAAGVVILDPAEQDEIVGIGQALSEHPLARDLLAGYVERSLVWRDEQSGVWLKSRPDAIPVSARVYGDLKTSREVSPQRVRKEFFEYGYHVQMALAEMGMEEILGQRMEEYAVVWVCSKPPHDVLISAIDTEAIAWGRRLIRRALAIFAECWAANRWPSYDARDGEYIRMPDWLRGQYEEMKLPPA